jgi:hypothetical protein
MRTGLRDRHAAFARGGIVNGQPAACASDQHNEMAHVPVEDAGKGELPQFVQLQAQSPDWQAHRSWQRDEFRAARTAHRNG